MADAPIRVFVADDHALFRDGLRALLLAQEDMTWIGDAASGTEAVALSAELRPDVILMDINMPDMNGIVATAHVLADRPDATIVMVTMLEDDASLFAALQAGARGYVLKGSNADEMLNVIRAAAQGQLLFGEQIGRKMLNLLHGGSIRQRDVPFPQLSERERELLAYIAAGLSNSEIASRLALSPKTVRNHITNIFAKLAVNDRAQAIVMARQAGLGGGYAGSAER